MIEKIFSKKDKNKLLHIIHRPSDNDPASRTDIVPASEFIQCSWLKMHEGTTFKPHRHIYKKTSYREHIAQESWVVVKGSVECRLYDLDNSLLHTTILREGEASFTLEGGHTYTILDDDTLVYEYKTGHYEGQKLDKEFI